MQIIHVTLQNYHNISATCTQIILVFLRNLTNSFHIKFAGSTWLRLLWFFRQIIAVFPCIIYRKATKPELSKLRVFSVYTTTNYGRTIAGVGFGVLLNDRGKYLLQYRVTNIQWECTRGGCPKANSGCFSTLQHPLDIHRCCTAFWLYIFNQCKYTIRSVCMQCEYSAIWAYA